MTIIILILKKEKYFDTKMYDLLKCNYYYSILKIEYCSKL